MQYSPGLHLLLDIKSDAKEKLESPGAWMDFIKQQITEFNLNSVGEYAHKFEAGGFTAIHGLTESHVSIHTWPEFGYCTCDIYLSNYQKDNSEKVKSFGKNVLSFFESKTFDWKEVTR